MLVVSIASSAPSSLVSRRSALATAAALGFGGSWLRSGDVVEVNWDDVWWPCDVLQAHMDSCTVKYHDGGDVEDTVEMAERVRRPQKRYVERDSVVEVWCEGLWCRGRVRSVEENSCAIDFFDGETREAVPLCELRAPRSDVVGRFMEAEVSPHDWRECEVLEAAGGRSQVRFLDGEEREVTKVRESPVPVYMLYVGQGCQGLVTRIEDDGEVLCDIGAEEVARIPARLLGQGAAMREDIDLGQVLDLWILGVDPSRRRILVTPRGLGAATTATSSAENSERKRRFCEYILRGVSGPLAPKN